MCGYVCVPVLLPRPLLFSDSISTEHFLFRYQVRGLFFQPPMGLIQFALVFERIWNRSLSINHVRPSLYFTFCCTRHVTHRSGFELCFPCATERRRAHRPSSGDARNSWAQEGCCTRNRAARWDPSVTLLSFCVGQSLLLLCSGGTASAPRPEPTSPASRPASQPAPRSERWPSDVVVLVVGLRRDHLSGLCRVGYLSAAGICCPGVGDSSSGRVKQHMTVSPCGRMQEGNHPGWEVWQHCLLLHISAAGGWENSGKVGGGEHGRTRECATVGWAS